MKAAHLASGADMVTVAVRRVDITRQTNRCSITSTPRRSSCSQHRGLLHRGRGDSHARLGREAGMSNWVKLEVIGDEQTLFPDNEGLLEATRCSSRKASSSSLHQRRSVMCRKLAEAGAAAVMPLGAPIGSGLGIQNPNNIRIIKEQARVPVIVDAGVGTASDAAVAMELGAMAC
jgi:thiazole synthase